MKLDHFLAPYTKIKSKWTEDLNVSLETIQVLEENIGGKLLDIDLSDDFSDMTPKTKATKAKITTGTHQTKKHLHSKRSHQQNEKATY